MKQRSYAETVELLYSKLPMFTRIGASAFKKDLTNTLLLCKELGNPEKQFRTIHIAGTNGKGSSSHMLASILQEAGYKTGLYTSPHLRDFRERIRINGIPISETEVIEFTDRMEESMDAIQPSFFELGVAMAFDHFARHQVDIAVIETGMGGRLDSTNVILPLLSVITNIGWDHMDFLGNTLPEIAGEKAGIIKPGIPVIISEKQQETTAVFESRAMEMQAPLYFASDHHPVRMVERKQDYQVMETPRIQLELDLLGNYQQYNLSGVLMSAELLNKQGFTITDLALKAGLRKVQSNTGLMGRWQRLNSSPAAFCDTGHNLNGMIFVLEMIRSYSWNKLHFVLGMVRDKDISKILSLLPQDAVYYFCQANIPRALPALELAAQAGELGLRGKVIPHVAEAYETALKEAGPDDFIFVGGSTFVVAEVV